MIVSLACFASACTEAVPNVASLSSFSNAPKIDNGVFSTRYVNIAGIHSPLSVSGTCDAADNAVVEYSPDSGNTWLHLPSGSDADCSDGAFTFIVADIGAFASFTAGLDDSRVYQFRVNVDGDTTDAHAMTVVYDGNAPEAEITLMSGQAQYTNTLPIRFLVTTSEPIDPFSLNDLDFGVASDVIAWTVTPLDSQHFMVEIIAATPDNGGIWVNLTSATFTDVAGNANSNSALQNYTPVTYDTIAPTLTFIAPSPGSSHNHSIGVQGICEGNGVVIATGDILNAPLSIPCSSGSFAQTLDLTAGDGGKTLTLSQTDLAGNSTTVSRSFINDETGPQVLGFVSPVIATFNQSHIGASVAIQIRFNEELVGFNDGNGIARLSLSGGLVAVCDSVNFDILNCSFEVPSGMELMDLAYMSISSLSLMGASSLHDVVGNDAILALPPPGAPQSMGAVYDIDIDTVPPTIGGLNLSNPTSSPGMANTPSFVLSSIVGATNVVLYGQSGCTGTVITSEMPSNGSVTLTVPVGNAHSNNETRTYSALALDDAGNGVCSGDVTYEYVPPAPALLTFNNPTVPGFLQYTDVAIVTFVVTNTGDLPATAITLGSGVSDPFEIVGSTCQGATLNANQSCTISVQYTGPLPGPVYNNTIVVNYNDGEKTTFASQNVNVYGIEKTIVVEPRYMMAPNWNDYVQLDGFTYQPCNDMTLNDPRACSHGGELRRVDLFNRANCGGITAIYDDLGAFNWKCIPGSPTQIVSTGLRADAGLSTLLDAGGWRQITLTVEVNNVIAYRSSPIQPWWGNNVVIAGNGHPRELNQSGAIYFFPMNAETEGHAIIADGVAVVIAQGAILRLSNTASGFFNPSTGMVGGSELDVIAAGGISTPRRYLWIEGNIFACEFDSTPCDVRADNGIALRNVSHSRLWRVGAARAGVANIFMQNVRANVFRHVRASNANMMGLMLTNTSFNIFSELTIDNSGQRAIWLQNGAQNNTFTRVLAVNNGEMLSTFPSIELVGPATLYNTFSFMTIANAARSAFLQNGADRTTLNQVVVVNHQNLGTTYAFDMGSSTNTRVSQLAAHSPANPNVYNGEMPLLGAGNLVISASGTCDGPGFLGSCMSASGLQVRTLISEFAFMDGWLGNDARMSDDPMNPHDVQGSGVNANSILDWLSFEHMFKVFKVPSTWTAGPCAGTMCEVSSWMLRSNSPLLNVSGNGTDNSENGSFVSGAPCPMAVNGVNSMEDGSGNRFLINAMEIIGDEIGDDDGLCESDEACIYAPNFGVYQGHGNLLPGSCSFMGGPMVQNVDLRAHSANGI